VTQRGFCYDTLPNPTTESNVVFVGDGVGEFEAVLSGLPVGKLYFVKAFATNAKGTTYGNQFDFYAGCDSKTVTDYDGNVYNTVLIGTQCWMKENLRTTHYADGWPLENTQFKYPGNSADNVGIYGLLYNRNVAMRGVNESSSVPSGVQGICPDGWHLPSNGEWNQLTTYVNNQYEYRCNGQANTYAKALADSIGWDYNAALADQYPCNIASGEGTNNATGFSARASGYIDGLNSYGFGTSFYCWSTSKVNSQGAIMYQIFKLDYRSHTAALGFNNGPRDTNPISVRCLRD
ncbi:MAG: fibrobacter succinogenes major paralogous domain-containing protein, partial [Bacteroidales bacterium]|nr:fibrobacter succinogenes major paralogous domain-containing protein [Bacteroidales bacterium]